jgi:hypothetical protein
MQDKRTLCLKGWTGLWTQRSCNLHPLFTSCHCRLPSTIDTQQEHHSPQSRTGSVGVVPVAVTRSKFRFWKEPMSHTWIKHFTVMKQNVVGRINHLLSFHYTLSIWYNTDSQKTSRPSVHLLLRVNSLSRESVYRTIAQQRPSLLALLFWLSDVKGDTHIPR